MVWHCHLYSHQTPFLQQRKLTLETHSARRAFLVQLRGADIVVWCLVLVPGGDKTFPWVNCRHKWRKVHVLTIFLLLVITWQKSTQSMFITPRVLSLKTILPFPRPGTTFFFGTLGTGLLAPGYAGVARSGSAERSSPFKPQQLIAATTCVTLWGYFLKIFQFFYFRFFATFELKEPRSILDYNFQYNTRILKYIALAISKKI